ncbi:hypothetical protein PHYBOEH_000807 [Phytophthora boehmeriae]|uniref:Uncharacterized protein n=1 Tax=Phytophthora boehmeriae TaxID=109152 RepID=A0A8T1X0C0_9STRA|nr:hypothetical protein PHYBOEH_000807 [Phytophthora boehmeriae]
MSASFHDSGTASVEEVQAWSSVVLNDAVKLERAAIDIDEYRIMYHLDLELERPILKSYLAQVEYLTLTWPIGGLWKIMDLSDDNRKVKCLSWRSTEMSPQDVEELAKKIETNSTNAAAKSDELPPTLFEWKMQLGKWGKNKHWFLRDVMPPVDNLGNSQPGPMTAHLLADFTPLEVQIEVSALKSVDTVEQTFSADVTWLITMPAITAIREDSLVRELLEIFDVDPNEFEFTNVNSVQEARDMTYSLSPAGPAHFVDTTNLAVPLEPTTEFLHHLQCSRRVVATFSEEMTLHNFPVDQQKLTFAFSTGLGVRKSLRITPSLIDAGTFNIGNYKLGNVFDVVHHDKVFVGEVDTEGDKKGIVFEMMLERRPGYYVTNVVIPAAIITYLSFLSYAALEDGKLMEMGDRLQIVLTLLLTAVTFKNQVASLTPQISYFTALDLYVYFCFIIASLVAIENALFPLIIGLFPKRDRWQQDSLLGISAGVFTTVNILWLIYVVTGVKKRKRASKVLMKVHEAIRVISSSIPAQHREAVLHEYLETRHFHQLPKINCTASGYLYVQLPEDSPPDSRIPKQQAKHETCRQLAEREFDAFKEIYEKLNPAASPVCGTWSESQKPLQAAKPNEAFLAGGGGRASRHSAAVPGSPVAALKGTKTQVKYLRMV